MPTKLFWLVLLLGAAHFAGCQGFNSFISRISNVNSAGPAEGERQQQRAQYQYD